MSTDRYEPRIMGGTTIEGDAVALTLASFQGCQAFDEILATAFIEERIGHFSGVTIFVGFDEHRQVALFIRSDTDPSVNLVVSVPMTPGEWLDRTEV